MPRSKRLRLELFPALATRTKIRVARVGFLATWLGRRLLGQRGARAICTRNGLRWDLDLREGIDLAIYLFGRFEVGVSRTLTQAVQPGMTVLDLGANVGAHTLPLARAVGPQGLVLAVEPTRWAFERLRQNLALNPTLADRVRPLQVALGEPGGQHPSALFSSWNLSRQLTETHAVHGGTAKSTGGSRFTTLDDLVDEQALTRVDLIKLDVDGHEARILRGGQRTLARLRPTVLLELCAYTLAEHGDRLEGLLQLLWAADYDLLHGDGSVLPHDPRAIERSIPSRGSINALAIPRR